MIMKRADLQGATGHSAGPTPNRFFSRSPATASRKGFTLVELMCVLTILSILAALYLPAIFRAFVKVKRFLSND